MKKRWSFLLASILTLCLILAGCSQAPAQASGDKAPAEDPASNKTYELTFNYFGPEMIPPGHWSEKLPRELRKKHAGVKIKLIFQSPFMYGDTRGYASGCDITFKIQSLAAIRSGHGFSEDCSVFRLRKQLPKRFGSSSRKTPSLTRSWRKKVYAG